MIPLSQTPSALLVCNTDSCIYSTVYSFRFHPPLLCFALPAAAAAAAAAAAVVKANVMLGKERLLTDICNLGIY